MFGQQVISYFVVAELSPVAAVVLCEVDFQVRTEFLHCATIFLVVKFLVCGSTCREEGVVGFRARHGGGGGESAALAFMNGIKLLFAPWVAVMHFVHRGQIESAPKKGEQRARG